MSDPLDVVDIGVGDNHLALVAEDGRLFVAGDNQTGQLGINSDEAWIDDWIEVPKSKYIDKLQGLVCGPKATFAYVDTPNPS